MRGDGGRGAVDMVQCRDVVPRRLWSRRGRRAWISRRLSASALWFLLRCASRLMQRSARLARRCRELSVVVWRRRGLEVVQIKREAGPETRAGRTDREAVGEICDERDGVEDVSGCVRSKRMRLGIESNEYGCTWSWRGSRECGQGEIQNEVRRGIDAGGRSVASERAREGAQRSARASERGRGKGPVGASPLLAPRTHLRPADIQMPHTPMPIPIPMTLTLLHPAVPRQPDGEHGLASG